MTPSSMKAVVADRFGGGWSVVEMATPRPSRDQVLVRVLASGVCYTDVHNLQNASYGATFPRIPGHEFVGEIVEVGGALDGHVPGDVVGVQWTQRTCRACAWCLSGREEQCAHALRTGGTVDGGHAEYAVVYADGVESLPEGLEPLAAAPVMCAGYTVYSALADVAVRPGEHVLVAGIGGLGHLAAQYALALGARVTAVTSSAAKREWLRARGVHATVDPADDEAMRQLADVKVDVLLCCGNALPRELLALVASYGRIALCGVSDEQLDLDVTSVIFKKLAVFGSSHGPRPRLREALDLHALSGATSKVVPFALDEAPEVLQRVKAGSVDLRAVFVP